MNPDRVLIFDLKGTWAHFRRVYTNSSSLTYAFPPRTTVAGAVAGILGRERDSYYEELAGERCRIALSIRTPTRRLIQTVNYISTKKEFSPFDGSRERTQVPVEFLLPAIDGEDLCFRVFFWHQNNDMMSELRSSLVAGRSVFPPYLGITECPGRVELATPECASIEWSDGDSQDVLPLSTVIPVSAVQPDALQLDLGVQIMKEDRIPLEFDAERYLKRIGDFLYERNCKQIRLKPSVPVFRVRYPDSGQALDEWGVFME